MSLVRYYGSFTLPSGYGRAARELANALERAGVAVDRIALMAAGAPAQPRIPDPDLVVVHTLPGDCARVLELEGLTRGGHARLVAYTTWETLGMPSALAAPLWRGFDEVWVPSRTTAAALQVATPDRTSAIRVIPHCFDELAEPATLLRTRDEARFRFYWIGAWTQRKNPSGLIRAFVHAFAADSSAELVLHSPGASMDTFIASLVATGVEQADLPTITLSNHHVAPDALARLHANSDCFVTAARGEAWNLPAFDAVLSGRHVISQYGLGSDEFLANTSAELVGGWPAPAHVDVVFDVDGAMRSTRGAHGLSSRSLWLEPDLDALAHAMRAALERKTRHITTNYDLAERFGYATVAKQAMSILETP